MSKSSEQGKRAIKYVIRHEKRWNRNPKDLSNKGLGYDIKSGNRYIEVKSEKWGWKDLRWKSIEATCVKFLKKHPKNYYVYIVCNIWKKPDLHIIEGKDLLKHKLLTPKSFKMEISKYKEIIS